MSWADYTESCSEMITTTSYLNQRGQGEPVTEERGKSTKQSSTKTVWDACVPRYVTLLYLKRHKTAHISPLEKNISYINEKPFCEQKQQQQGRDTVKLIEDSIIDGNDVKGHWMQSETKFSLDWHTVLWQNKDELLHILFFLFKIKVLFIYS